MAGKLLHMNKVKEIIRLKEQGFSKRKIAKILNCSRDTVKKYLNEISSNHPAYVASAPSWMSHVDWEMIGKEISKKTPIKVLWEELCKEEKVPIDYPGFWKQVQKKFPSSKQSMHRVFQPGERIEIDYADGINIFNPVTGEVLSTELFVGVLCYSRYVFAEFSLSQKSEDFLSSHVRMFQFFGGTAQLLSPDNLKSAVTKAHRYDPEINPAYQRLANHYEVAVVPARVRTPKDKAIVERTIQSFQRWFYFLVRHRTFTSLLELNSCLKKHLETFHEKQHRMLRKTRKEAFSEERSSLKDLPQNDYEVQTHHRTQLSEDCHFVFEKNFYSAPFIHRGKTLDIWATPQVVEVYCERVRIAVHNRARAEGKWMTDSSHYPKGHQAYAETTSQSVLLKAQEVGPGASQLIQSLFSVKYPLQNLRRAQGIIALLKSHSKQSLEEACIQANSYDQNTLHYIKRVLKLKETHPSVREEKIERNFNPFLRGNSGLFH